MFKFLKDKLKGVLSKISKDVEEEVPDEVVEVTKEVKPKKAKKKEEKEEKVVEEKKGFLKKIFKKKEEKEIPKKKEEVDEKKGFFGKIKEKVVTKKISSDKFEKLFWDLEVALLENNVALQVVEKIKEDLKKLLVDKPIKRGEVSKIILRSLKESLQNLFNVETFDLIKEIKKKKEKPYVIALLGVNGSGKTTSIAKLTHLLKKNNLKVVLVGADTFRAGSKEQLKEWSDKLKVKLIVHDYGSDPAAVCFDGVAYAKKQGLDVVLIDTAGRQHSNVNLVKQMEKIVRVAKPDLKIFVGESITGNDAVEQAIKFNEAVGIDSVILTKADVDEKGGAMISVSYVTGKPILYLGVGQSLDDLEKFDSEKILRNLGLE